jgi:hypothetical protein
MNRLGSGHVLLNKGRTPGYTAVAGTPTTSTHTEAITAKRLIRRHPAAFGQLGKKIAEYAASGNVLGLVGC